MNCIRIRHECLEEVLPAPHTITTSSVHRVSPAGEEGSNRVPRCRMSARVVVESSGQDRDVGRREVFDANFGTLGIARQVPVLQEVEPLRFGSPEMCRQRRTKQTTSMACLPLPPGSARRCIHEVLPARPVRAAPLELNHVDAATAPPESPAVCGSAQEPQDRQGGLFAPKLGSAALKPLNLIWFHALFS